MPGAIGQLLIENWTWVVGALLTGLLAFWWWDERQEADSPGETVDRVTDRAESATGGALGGFRALVVGILSIGLTVVMEVMQLAGELNQLFGGVPFILGYFLFGVLSFFGITVGMEPETLGFLFILILIVAAMMRFGGSTTTGAS